MVGGGSAVTQFDTANVSNAEDPNNHLKVGYLASKKPGYRFAGWAGMPEAAEHVLVDNEVTGMSALFERLEEYTLETRVSILGGGAEDASCAGYVDYRPMQKYHAPSPPADPVELGA